MGARSHYCRYGVMRSSVTPDGWSERCVCGRFANVSLQRSENEKKVTVKAIKHWFDREGHLEKVTGDITSNAL